MLARGQSVYCNKSGVSRVPTSMSWAAMITVDASTLVRWITHFPATNTAAKPSNREIRIIHIALLFFIPVPFGGYSPSG